MSKGRKRMLHMGCGEPLRGASGTRKAPMADANPVPFFVVPVRSERVYRCYRQR